jgi:hypothetical protein
MNPELYKACKSGQLERIKHLKRKGHDLLSTFSETEPRKHKGCNCLEVAIVEGKEEVVEYLLESDDAFKLMRNAQLEDKERWCFKFTKVDTPMRKLVKDMPKMACKMLDKCKDRESDEYEFLEDQYAVKGWDRSGR